MKLSDVIEGMEILSIEGDRTAEVRDIAYDSRSCLPGSLFVAVSGFRVDGHDYIGEAIRSGAAAVVGERDFPCPAGISSVKVKDSRRALGIAAKNFYGNPSSDLCLIGITGTNGKTTITYILESILKAAGRRAGVIGTVNSRLGDSLFPTANTTPESLDLQKILREMAKKGASHAIMEVSSHAVDLKRIDDCTYALGVFTNLSPEHLDYHHNMETYFNVKKRFFIEVLRGRPKIVNIDNPWGMRLLKEVEGPVVTFGIDNQADVRTGEYSLSIRGIEAKIETAGGTFSVASPLAGRFNLSNILAAVAVSRQMGIEEGSIRKGIADAHSVPGRLERVSGRGEPPVFVDYAHTEDALRNVLETLSRFERSRLITVFGCGGQRDRMKRPCMGRVATELSDISIIPSDNPREEDPLEIIKEIEAGVDGATVKKYASPMGASASAEKGYMVIPDRREAIEQAILSAEPGDIVLIAGKGHEDYQILGSRRISFDDRAVARNTLKKWRSERGC